MSTSLLYHGWGVRGYDYQKTEYAEGVVRFHIRDPRRAQCVCCGSENVIGAGTVEREFKTLPIGRKPVELVFPIPRVECLDCGRVRQVAVRFADRRRSYTRKFERYALELSEAMTIQDVAEHLGVDWGTIKEIQKRDLRQRFKRVRLKDLREIAIDEISIGKGHRFVTVVLDLRSGAVVYIGKGKGADALDGFWRRLRSSKAKILAVATDMSAAYRSAVREHLPRAVHVIDRFHVMKLFNEKLSDLRRDVQREAEAEAKDVLKGTRWLLLKDPANLEEERDEAARLEAALELNKPLATGYYMREEFNQFWSKGTRRAAAAFLDRWIRRARDSGIRMLKTLAATFADYREELLAWHRFPISTGPLEGTNNKIKTMQRQHYGLRDEEFFRLKIFALHECTYALIG